MSGGDGRDGRDADLSARLHGLDKRLDGVRDRTPRERAEGGGSTGDASALGKAFRLSTEFVAGVLAGGGLGWVFDRFLGTSPWGLIVFLMLGFGAGIANAMRAAGFFGGAKPPGGDA